MNVVAIWLWKWLAFFNLCSSAKCYFAAWVERADDYRASWMREREGTAQTHFSQSFLAIIIIKQKEFCFSLSLCRQGRQVSANCQLPVNTQIKAQQPLWGFSGLERNGRRVLQRQRNAHCPWVKSADGGQTNTLAKAARQEEISPSSGTALHPWPATLREKTGALHLFEWQKSYTFSFRANL